MSRNATVVVSMHDSHLSTAASRRMRALLDELDRRGEDVLELCPPADGARERPGVRRSPAWLQRLLDNRRPIPLRIAGEVLQAVWLVAVLIRIRPARMLVTIPHVPAALPALVSRLWRCHVVLEVRDLTWEYAAGTSASRALRAFSWASAQLICRAARGAVHVVGTTRAQADSIQRLAPTTRVHVIRNGVSASLCEALSPLRDIAPRTTPPLIVYAGTLGHAQDPAQLLRIAELWPEAELVLVGDGSEREAIRARIPAHPNVTIHDPMPFEDLVATYAEASVLVACLRTGASFATAVPSKLYEYAATGRVVAFVGPGEARAVTCALGGVAAEEVHDDFVDALRRSIRCRPADRALELPKREAGAARVADLLLEPR